MKFELKNVARVANAKIDLNGITIIVGDNNTGKTTVGRALYSFFNALSGINDRVPQLRTSKCFDVVSAFLMERSIRTVRPSELHRLCTLYIKDGNEARNTLVSYIQNVLRGSSVAQADIDGLLDRLRHIRVLPERDVRNQIVSNYFYEVFHGQYMPAKPTDAIAPYVESIIKGVPIRFNLTDSGVTYDSELDILHRAYFVDTPDLLQDITADGLFFSHGQGSGLGASLVSAIKHALNSRKSDPAASAVDDLLVSDSINDLLIKIGATIHGEVSNRNIDDMARFVDQEMGGFPVDLANVSRGIRAFALLHLALKCKVIQKKDILVLDEPEIHLHPDWQLAFAEIIVLLQKAFDLTLLITTHSANFLQAVQLYSEKHNRKAFVNAYKARKRADGNSEIVSVDGNNWDEAYLSFMKSVYHLRRLRNEVRGHGTMDKD